MNFFWSIIFRVLWSFTFDSWSHTGKYRTLKYDFNLVQIWINYHLVHPTLINWIKINFFFFFFYIFKFLRGNWHLFHTFRVDFRFLLATFVLDRLIIWGCFTTFGQCDTLDVCCSWLFEGTTALQYHCNTVLLHRCTTVPEYINTTALLY